MLTPPLIITDPKFIRKKVGTFCGTLSWDFRIIPYAVQEILLLLGFIASNIVFDVGRALESHFTVFIPTILVSGQQGASTDWRWI
jgi:hypothetical protein